jgi:hypothetical protein
MIRLQMRRLTASLLTATAGLGLGWLGTGLLVGTHQSATKASTAAAPAAAIDDTALQMAFEANIQPVFERLCYDCHGDGMHKGGFTFDKYDSIASMRADRRVWRSVREHLHYQIMPPGDEDQPSQPERDILLGWIDDAVFTVDPRNPDPGRVTVRRLNRAEYENTLRDLLGVPISLASQLPQDDSGYGYDNIGDVLTLAPAHLERYLKAAEDALATAFDDPTQNPVKLTTKGATMIGGGTPQGDSLLFVTNARARTQFNLPRAGTYTLEVVAGGDQAGPEPAIMKIYVSGQTSFTVNVPQVRDHPGTFTWESHMPAGKASISVEFTNDYYDETITSGSNDRNLLLKSVTLSGPAEASTGARPAGFAKAFPARPPQMGDEDYASSVIQQFARRAFRRPVSAEETSRFMRFVALAREQNDPLESGIRLAMQAILVSPDFLFRELDAVRNPAAPGTVQQVPEIALASRMSYFLWSSMPDEELLALAENGQLRTQLDAQVRRMLKDPRSIALVDRMFSQWLQFSNVLLAAPSTQAYPSADEALRRSMIEETQRFCANLIREDRPVLELINADYSFVDARLAKHYGLKEIPPPGFAKVSLAGTPRRGVLTHGSILTITSNRSRTSPVLRGKWVLENLLNIEPPPPPPNVASLESARNGKKPAATLREELEIHRADPACASCHRLMDGIGFSFEHFDGVGSWRDSDNGRPIDPNGELITGEAFNSPESLAKIIATDRREDFLRCVAVKTLTFALGRGLDYYDAPALETMVAHAKKHDLRFSAFVHATVASVPFQYRRFADPSSESAEVQAPR